GIGGQSATPPRAAAWYGDLCHGSVPGSSSRTTALSADHDSRTVWPLRKPSAAPVSWVTFRAWASAVLTKDLVTPPATMTSVTWPSITLSAVPDSGST